MAGLSHGICSCENNAALQHKVGVGGHSGLLLFLALYLITTSPESCKLQRWAHSVIRSRGRGRNESEGNGSKVRNLEQNSRIYHYLMHITLKCRENVCIIRKPQKVCCLRKKLSVFVHLYVCLVSCLGEVEVGVGRLPGRKEKEIPPK